MTGHRIWFAALAGWLFLLSALDPIQGFYAPDRFLLGACHLLVMLPFCWPAARFSRLGCVAFGLVLLWAARFGWHSSFAGFEPGLAIFESALLFATAFLSVGFACRFHEAAGLESKLTRLNLPQRCANAALAGLEMEREIRRARRYHRPLSMITVETRAQNDSIPANPAEDARNPLTQSLAISRVAEILQNETKSTDIVSYADGRFVMMLPETRREEAAQLVVRLKNRIHDLIGWDLNIGLSSFPSEEITIFGLMERSAPKEPAVIRTVNPHEFIEEIEPEHVMVEAV